MKLTTVWSVGRIAAEGGLEHLVLVGDVFEWSTKGETRFAEEDEAAAALASVADAKGAQVYPTRVGKIRL